MTHGPINIRFTGKCCFCTESEFNTNTREKTEVYGVIHCTGLALNIILVSFGQNSNYHLYTDFNNKFFKFFSLRNSARDEY